MKIAMFTDTYLPMKDGVVTSILTSREQLEKHGHEVIIFAPEPARKEDREEGVYYYRAKEFKNYPGYNLPIYPEEKQKILKELDVDVIHCHALAFMALRSMLDARITKKPIVVTFHTMVTDAARFYNPLPISYEKTSELIWIYLKELLSHADCVIAPTEAIEKELLNHVPKIKQISVVPTGIDCSRFDSADSSKIRHRHNLDGKKVILQLGRVAKEKNLELVFDSIAECIKKDSSIRLLIAGSGPAKEYYEDYAHQLGLEDKAVFAGFVPDEELPEYYAACDAFITASKFETQGLTTLEAMACGKPVAGINYRATAELIKDGENGYLFEDDVSSCSDAIFRVLKDKDIMKEAALHTAEEYSSEKCTERLLCAYESAIRLKKERLSR